VAEPSTHPTTPGPTPDRITLRGVRAHANHGVYAFERERGQMFRVDAVLELDTVAAAAGDDLEKTVNYAELAQKLYAVLTGEPVNLLETLAQRLADVCLAGPLVDAVEITVHKPQAELGVPFDDVTVAIRRQKDPSLPTTRTLAAGPGDGPKSP
jgi:dihydroneopterin aldolase